MKVRNVLAAAVCSVGATALANRLLTTRAEGFEPYLDGDQGTYRWRGFDVAYAELGDPESEDVILLHGISAGAGNHEFAEIAESLAEQYHVIAPDLPGFGHSDRPPLLYSGSLYTTFVKDVIDDLTDDPMVVASSLTAAYVADAADDVDVSEYVLVCPTESTVGDQKVWLRALIRSPVIGQGLFNLLVSKRGLAYFQNDHGYYNMDNYTDDIHEYEWVTAHQPGARFAPASFASGFLNVDEDMGELLADIEAPVTLVWGRNSELLPLSRGRSLAEDVDAGLVVFDKATLLPHTEHPEQFVDLITDGVPVEQ